MPSSRRTAAPAYAWCVPARAPRLPRDTSRQDCARAAAGTGSSRAPDGWRPRCWCVSSWGSSGSSRIKSTIPKGPARPNAHVRGGHCGTMTSEIPATQEADHRREAVLKLKRGEERRIRAGHLWVFSNEVDNDATPLTEFAPGSLARVTSDRDQFLGFAYVNPHALICARILGRDRDAHFD